MHADFAATCAAVHFHDASALQLGADPHQDSTASTERNGGDGCNEVEDVHDSDRRSEFAEVSPVALGAKVLTPHAGPALNGGAVNRRHGASLQPVIDVARFDIAADCGGKSRLASSLLNRLLKGFSRCHQVLAVANLFALYEQISLHAMAAKSFA